ncbi:MULTISPECIES: hypothetical protein [unclassified Bradyrhizobium]|uniref:hypothetical protein n=1 Tax=unclassified Bradyrhizobium TaxID=2631580 RepID=UPI002916B665|nr:MULTISPECIES: hypothetical protein [unclassified Bradyrhizobium]
MKLRYGGTPWICEAHLGRPADGSERLHVRRAGHPCPFRNATDGYSLPELPRGFEVDEVHDLETDPLIIDREERKNTETALNDSAARVRKVN